MTPADGPFPIPTEIAIAVVEHRGQFLVGLRPDGAPLAGYWEFPGGKVHPTESPADAAVRECLEETGLAVRITGTYPGVMHDYAHARVHLHFFAGSPIIEPQDLSPRFRWVAATALGELTFPPANAQLLDLLGRGEKPRALAGSR